MNQWRLPLILILSIVFGAPVLGGLLQSDGDMLVSGLQYAAALGLAWLGVSAITRIIDTFDQTNRRRELERLRAEAEAEARAEAEMRARERAAADLDPDGTTPQSDRTAA